MAMDIHDLEQSWRTAPGDPETFSALAGRYIVDGNWRALVTLFEEGEPRLGGEDYGSRLVQALRELQQNAGDDEERGGILVAIGDACLRYLDDREQAMKAYQESFKTNPRDTTSLERARDIYRKTGDWERVFLLYKLELKVKTEPRPRADVLARMAQVRAEYVDDIDGGLQIIEEALKLDPDHGLSNELLTMYRDGKTYRGKVEATVGDAREAADADEPEMASELYRLAAQFEIFREGGSVSSAADYAAEAVRVAPHDKVANALYRELMRRAGREAEIVDEPGPAQDEAQGVAMMAPVQVGEPTNGHAYDSSADYDDYDEAAETQRIDLNALDGGQLAEPADHAAEDEEELEAQDLESGESAQTQRLDLNTLDMYRTEDREHAEVSEVSEAQSTMIASPAMAVDYEDGAESATLDLDRRVDDDDDYVEAPRDEERFPDHEDDEAESEDHEDLEEIELDEAVEDSEEEPGHEELVEPSEEEFEDEELVQASEEELVEESSEPEFSEPSEPDYEPSEVAVDLSDLEGIDQYVDVLKGDPVNLEVLRGLHALVEETGQWDVLVQQYERSVKRLRKQEGELEIMLALANALWHQVGEMDRAEYFFKRIKLLDSENDEMLAFYETYFEDRGEWRKLYAMLSTAQQHASDPERKRALTERLAVLAEQSMDSPEKAIEVWKNFAREYPGDDQARTELRRLYQENAKWSALVDFYKDDLHTLEESGASEAERIDLLREMARIYDEHLGLEPMVINTLQEILALDPGDDSAFTRLRELLVSGRRMNDLANLLTDRAEKAVEAGDIATASDYYMEVASIWMDDLKNVTQALPHLERVMEIDPSNAEVRERLKGIYEKRRDYASLFEVQRAEVRTLEGDERLQGLRDLVDLSIDRIRDPSLAVPVLREILEIVPDDREALGKLEFIHRRRDEFAELAEVLVLKAQHSDTTEDAKKALGEAAAIQETRLQQPEMALETWKTVLEIDPMDARATGALTRMYIAAHDFEALDALYRERGSIDELYDVLDSAAGTSEDVESRQALYRQLANLAERDLRDPQRVIISLESLLEIADDPVLVSRELIPWYQEVGDIEREIAANEMILASHGEGDSRLDTLERLRELQAQRDDQASALRWALEAVKTAPRDEEVAARAEELARQVDALESYLQTLEDVAEVTEDEELQIALWSRIGEIQWKDLGSYGTAVIYYERLYQADPSNLDYLGGLEQLYALNDEGEKRIQILRAQIDVLKDQGASESDVVDEYVKIADVQREMGEPDAARTTYAEILDMDPEHLGALRGIKEIYRSEERWDDVVEVLLQEQGLVSLDEIDRRVQLDLELADVYRLHLGEPGEALRYYGQVLSSVPDQEEAVAAVETFLSEPELAREAALLLEPIFRDAQLYPQLVRALEARREFADDRFEKAEILDELIPIYMEQLDDRETAFERACRQFELDPDRSEIWLRLEQLGATLDRWEALEDIFSRYAPEDKQAHPTRFDLLKHLAAIREYKLGMQEEALDAWEQLHDYDPHDIATMEALDRLYRGLGRFDRLVGVLEARAEVAEPEERVALLLEASQVSDQVVGDVDRTIDLYRKVLIADPEQVEAVEGLRGLLQREERWGELEELLSNQADFAADPDRRQELQMDLARVRWAYLAEYAGAVEVIRSLLMNDPRNTRALAELEHLDERLEQEGNGELRLELVAIAEPLHRANEDWNSLVRVLNIRLENIDDPFDRVALLDELADLYVSPLEDYESAFTMVSEAVKTSPEDEERRAFLEELGEHLGKIDEVLAALAFAADNADSYVAGDLMRRMGELYRDRMGLADEAIACFEHALSANPTDEELLAGLGNLYEQIGNHEKLAENLRQQSIYGPPERRPEFLRRIGIIESDILGRPDKAISAYEELLEAEPGAEDAAQALELLYEREGHWVELAEILRRQSSMATDAETRLATLSRLAIVQESSLDDTHSAIQTYREILGAAPGNENALDQLERLHTAEEQWAELSEILRAKLVTERADTDFDYRNATELRLASVLATELYAVDEALGLFRGVLDRDPGNPKAIAAIERVAEDDGHVDQVAEDLVPHYIEHQDWHKLVALYERLAERTHDPELRSDYWHRIARRQRDDIGDSDAAISAMATAWKMDVSRDELHDELLSLVAQQQDWERLASIYRDVLVEVSDPDRMLELRMLLASLYYEQLDDRDEAEVHYREALAVDDRNLEAYGAIESILTAQERWHDLVALLESKFAATASDDPSSARLTLHRIAQIQEEMVEDAFSAVDTYNRILEIEPTDPDALAGVERLYRRQERWEDLNAHLIRRIELTSDPDQLVDLKFELAKVVLDKLHDPLGALDLLAEVLQGQPEHEETLVVLQRIFEEMEDFRVDAGRLLEPVLRRHELWDNLVIVLRTRAEHVDYMHEAPQLLREVGEIARERVGDDDLALEVYEDLFMREPSDESVRQALQDITAGRQSWSSLAQTYQRVLDDNYEVDDALRVELLHEQARIYEERVEDLDNARETYEKIGTYDPEYEPALGALDRIYSRQQDWTALGELYRRRADFTLDPEQRAEWLYNLANLHEEILEDLDGAIDIYNEIIAVEPDSPTPRRILERLLRQAGRWDDLATLYREQAETAESEEDRLDHRFRLAQLLEGELERIDEALEIYREIIAANPSHYEARGALEGLARDLALSDSSNDDFRIQIYDMLLSTYDREQDLERVVSLLEEKVALVRDVMSKVDIHRQIAELLEDSPRTEDRIRGMVALANAFRVDPRNEDLKRRVHKVAMETETWDKLIPLYLSGLSLDDDTDTHVALLLAVAEIYHGPLADRESAITAYQQVMSLDQDNEKALSQLEKLYSELELWEPLVEVLLRRIDVVYDGELQERLLRRVAMIQEEILANPQEAVGSVERLREIDPANLEYVATLERLYEETKNFEELEELLRLKVGLLMDEQKQLKALRNLARIQDEHLGRPHEAIESYRQVLSIDENDVASVKALTRLFGKTERWEELLETLQLERDFADGVNELNAVELRMGIVYAERLNSGPAAIEKFRGVLERDPKFAAARGAMRKLLSNPETGIEVEAILENLFTEGGEWEELAKLYESLLEQVEDLDRRREAYLKLGRLQESELDNPQMAFITYGRATREEPGHEPYRSNLERLAEGLDSLDTLLAVYEDCAEAGTDDPDVQRYLHNRLGEIYFQMEEFGAAIEHFEKTLQIDELDPTALGALDELFQIEQQWDRLSDVLERELKIADADAVNDTRYRLGYLNEVMFENRDRALDLYAQILVEEPGHRNTVEAMDRLLEHDELRSRIIPILEPILHQLGEWDMLVRMYQMKLDDSQDPIDRAMVLEKMANVHLDHLENLEVGYAYLSRALRADAGNTEVQIRLESLVDSIDMHEELVALYEEIIEGLSDEVRIVELALVAGTIAYSRLDDVGRAWKTFERILEIDQDNEAALAAMEEIARDQGDSASLAAVLAREADVVFDPDQRLRILRDLGAERMKLEEFDKALEAYRSALEIDESDAQVMSAMVELLEITEQYDELVELMQRLVMFETDESRKYQLYVRMGRYSRVLLDDTPRAIDAYREALILSPDDDDVLSALQELYEEIQDWDTLRQVLGRRIEVNDAGVAVPLYVRMAEISHRQFNEVERAIEEYEAALTIRPDSEEVLAALASIYREEGRWAELLSTYQRVFASTNSNTARAIALQVEMADISANLGDDETAIGYLEQILESDPNHLRALDVLADLYGRRGDWDRGLKVMERRMKACRTVDEQIEALMHRAHIFDDELDRPKDAANDYVRIIELEPLHDEALTALKSLYGERLGAHKALFDILKYEASHRETAEEKLAIYLRMAEIAEKELGNVASSIEALELAYSVKPSDLEIVGPLLDAYISGGEVAKAEPLLEAIIEQLRSERKMKEVVRFLHLQGKLAEQKGDLDAAYEAYDSAHKVDASYIPNLLSLGTLLYQREEWDDALKIFQTLLLHQMNIEKDEDKVSIYFHLGMVRWHQGDMRRAKDMFNRALNIDPNHQASRDAIAQL